MNWSHQKVPIPDLWGGVSFLELPVSNWPVLQKLLKGVRYERRL
jgi:hypothetical protein